MSEIGQIGANAFAQLTAAKVNNATHQAQSSSGESKKIDRSAREFESILLSTWLQSAEKSFATVPGSDDDEEKDPTKNQFQGYAMQAVASALTSSGGIGIASMISSQLHKNAALEQQSPVVEEKSETR